jgi:hypothetical protein
MQVATVPKEVIWATKLLWIWSLINIIVVYALSDSYEIETLLIYVMVASPMFVFIFGINFFIKKANRLVMWFLVIVLVLVVLLDISTLLFPSSLTAKELEGIPARIIRILFGLPIVYLLLKQKEFFK